MGCNCYLCGRPLTRHDVEVAGEDECFYCRNEIDPVTGRDLNAEEDIGWESEPTPEEIAEEKAFWAEVDGPADNPTPPLSAEEIDELDALNGRANERLRARMEAEAF